ncbi:MAG: monovalent cation/H+ antiporter complex subunit F [Actinomycetota bacterium]|jgi:multisubunit Na+/H+ antiporter MnhF subunit|nr:monovalent cation/H+ antiporter complex subunit F [Actinomycetota bacterium]
MHQAVFYVAALWLTGLVIACALRVLSARSTASRILALDTLVLILIGLLVLWSDAEGVAYFLDAALVLSVLAFAATLAAARFHGDGRIF